MARLLASTSTAGHTYPRATFGGDLAGPAVVALAQARA